MMKVERIYVDRPSYESLSKEVERTMNNDIYDNISFMQSLSLKGIRYNSLEEEPSIVLTSILHREALPATPLFSILYNFLEEDEELSRISNPTMIRCSRSSSKR